MLLILLKVKQIAELSKKPYLRKTKNNCYPFTKRSRVNGDTF